jgi:predicted nucleic acid-binding Zn ribbon protein
MYMSSLLCASPDSGGEEKPLMGLVKKVIKGLGGEGRLTEEEIRRAWREAVGIDAARHSRPVSFKRSSVFVNVDRSSWLYELTVRKKEILAKLEAGLKGKRFKDIRFRIGEITAERPKAGETKKEQGI